MSSNTKPLRLGKEIRLWLITVLTLWIIKLIPNKPDKEYNAIANWILNFPNDTLKPKNNTQHGNRR